MPDQQGDVVLALAQGRYGDAHYGQAIEEVAAQQALVHGPPVGAYGLCMGWEPRVLLGTLGVFFVLRATVTLVLQGMAGFYTPTVLTCAMYGAPGIILGTCIAFPVVKHISQQAFRKVLLCVIAVAGLVCLVRALG